MHQSVRVQALQTLEYTLQDVPLPCHGQRLFFQKASETYIGGGEKRRRGSSESGDIRKLQEIRARRTRGVATHFVTGAPFTDLTA